MSEFWQEVKARLEQYQREIDLSLPEISIDKDFANHVRILNERLATFEEKCKELLDELLPEL